MATDTTVDGRAARAARTRDAVVEALLALIDEGDLRPTARRVAERAGVSLRSVYVHFDDLEDLFCAAARRQFTRVAELIETLPTTGPLDARLDALVAQRARVLEAGDAVRRAALLHAPFSPTLARVVDLARRAGRAEVEKVFGPELEAYEGEDRHRMVAALTTVAGASTWESLRHHEGLDLDAAASVLRLMLRALLDGGSGGTPPSRRAASRAAPKRIGV